MASNKLCILALVLSVVAMVHSALVTETVYDAARIARVLVETSTTSIGNMATIFPNDDPALPNFPFSMQEYYARRCMSSLLVDTGSCYSNGSLTLLFLPISRHSKNVMHASSHSASISVTSATPAASRPRVSLLGNITVFTDIHMVPDRSVIEECYLAKHRDARRWLPDDEDAAHVAYWARFDPHVSPGISLFHVAIEPGGRRNLAIYKAIYFIGGFGGLHYIGWVPLGVYQNSTTSTTSGAGEPQSVLHFNS